MERGQLRRSGGAILLRADRVSGPGSLEAFAGNASFLTGRIRIESYQTTLTGSSSPTAVVAQPGQNGNLNSGGLLTVFSIDGVNVPAVPGGMLATPDVVFTST